MAEGEEGAGRGSGSVPREDVAAVQEEVMRLREEVRTLQGRSGGEADAGAEGLASVQQEVEALRSEQSRLQRAVEGTRNIAQSLQTCTLTLTHDSW